MKRDTLLKSTLGLLAIAGACLPISALAENDKNQSMMSYGEDALYVNLGHNQFAQAGPAQSGAQGPLRTESMGPTWSYGEDALYVNLSSIQPAQPEPGQSGAQGPIRTESMDQTYSLGQDTP
jgi:hypothetical protein